MPSNGSPRPSLSAENSDRLNQALLLSDELQASGRSADPKLIELKGLLESCRDGVRRQNPDHQAQRLQALDQARNYLRFLPHMEHEQAAGRLRSVSQRLRRALKS